MMRSNQRWTGEGAQRPRTPCQSHSQLRGTTHGTPRLRAGIQPSPDGARPRSLEIMKSKSSDNLDSSNFGRYVGTGVTSGSLLALMSAPAPPGATAGGGNRHGETAGEFATWRLTNKYQKIRARSVESPRPCEGKRTIKNHNVIKSKYRNKNS